MTALVLAVFGKVTTTGVSLPMLSILIVSMMYLLIYVIICTPELGKLPLKSNPLITG